MGEKDITEKLLEDYNDVFADIVNVLLFGGREVVNPSSLEPTKLRTQYKADDSKMHEMERDVAKNWTEEGVTLALYGMENESVPEKVMPIRIFGYEGNSYRSQLLKGTPKQGVDGEKKKENMPLYPVVTIVLHFGNKRWNYPKNLKGVIPVPKCLDQYVNDFKIHVFEIAWLTDEQVSMFKSDFRVVAEYFTQVRKNKRYVPSTQEIKHVDAVLKMLAVFGGNEALDMFIKKEKSKEGSTMEGYIDKYIRERVEQEVEEATERHGANILLKNSNQLAKKLNLSLEETLDLLGITMEDYEKAKEMVG